MPEWVTWIGGAAAFVLAVGVIWGKVIKPGASLISLLDDLIPLAQELVRQFENAPQAFKTLAVIAREFEANAGKSLRDVINRLEETGFEDRKKITELVEKLDAVNEKLIARKDG
jgi:hypothetical protein